jgi:hypothetical protein
MPNFVGSGSIMNRGNDSGGVGALASAIGGNSGGGFFGGDSGWGSDSASTFGVTKSGSDSNGKNAQDGAPAAKVGKGSNSTIANLAQGAMDVARAKLTERIGETTGGKIAAAIKASGQGAETNTSSTFNDNSLSAGTSEPVDIASEVAAFRDRTS